MNTKAMRVIFFLATLAAVPSVMAQDMKIAVCDLEGVIAMSKHGKALQDRLKALQEGMTQQIQAMSTEAQGLNDQLSNQAASLSDAKKSEIVRKLQDMEVAVKRLRDDTQKEAGDMQTAALREIELKLKPIFEKLRDEEGYDLILNTAQGVILLSSKKVDISEKVLAQLNAL